MSTPTTFADLIEIDRKRFRLPKHFEYFRLPQYRLAEQAAALFESGVDVVAVEATVGFGKAQPLSEPVLTPFGFKPMGEIRVGSLVFDEDGKYTYVTQVTPQGKKDVFTITFNDGSSTRSCIDHLWKVRATGTSRWRTVSLAHMLGMDYTDLHIPIAKPVELPERHLPVDPYLLGFLIGDGSLNQSSVGFTTADLEIVDFVKQVIPGDLEVRKLPSSEYGYSIVSRNRIDNNSPNTIVRALQYLGLKGKKSGEKFVPDMYKYASIEQRLLLLKGLMDSDGCNVKGGVGTEFCSKSKQLALDVVEIVQSLGGVARTRSRFTSRIRNKAMIQPATYWRVNAKLMECPFRLSRKVAGWTRPTKYPPARLVKSIEWDSEEECQCIAVVSESKTYLTKDYIVTHNSLFAEMVRQLLGKRMLFAAPRIDLQRQFSDAFPYSDLIQGRSNFPHGGEFGMREFPKVTCADCRENHYCRTTGCVYKEAKQRFITTGRVGVTNTSYWMACANYLRMFRPGAGYAKEGDEERYWGDDYLTCFDEADLMEDVLLNFLGFEITPKYIREVIESVNLEHKYPEKKLKKAPVSDFSKWPEWLDQTRTILEESLKRMGKPNNRDVHAVRWYNKLFKKILSLNNVKPEWIYDPERAFGKDGSRNGPAEKIKLQPKFVGEQGNTALWDKCGKTLVMSGSFANIECWKRETGFEHSGKTLEFLKHESMDWPKENRRIHRVSGIRVSKEDKKLKWSQQPFWDEYIGKISLILMRYPGERTFIHSHSYELGIEIGEALQQIFDKDRIIIDYGDKSVIEEDDTPEQVEEKLLNSPYLKQYLATPGSVLISPRMGRGTDLKDWRCRNIILAKTPFPYIGDRRVKSFIEPPEGTSREERDFGKLWYLIKAVREVIQVFGRGIREKTDWARIWVMDDCFDQILDCRGLLSDYLKVSVRPKDDFVSKYPPCIELEVAA